MEPLIVIPARYQSSRYPGKPLAEISGKSLLRRVWERCVPVLGPEKVVVATDDDRIAAHCTEEGMRHVITSSTCPTGTDRVAEVARILRADLYVNVQGDEPLVNPNDIQTVIDAAQVRPGEVINAYCSITQETDYRSRTLPKVVLRPDSRLLYMSRAPIPGTKEDTFEEAWKQVCIYAFPPDALHAFANHDSKTPLEALEDIEILRFLELGYEVCMVPVSASSIAVDVPEDVARVERALEQRSGH